MKKPLLLVLAAGLATPMFGASTWNPIGEGTLVESFYDYVEEYFPNIWEPDWAPIPVGEELTVEFEENADIPGMYRLVNPYMNWSGDNSADFVYDDLHNYYLIIHAEDPEYVYIETSESGIKANGQMTKIHSNINTFVQMYGVELTREFYPEGGGKLIDGVLTFPVEVGYAEGMNMLVHAISNIYYTSCPANGTGHLEIIFPGAGNGNEDSGIGAVTEADGPAEYYKLDGTRVENPGHGLYIVRKGGRSVKIIL